MLPSIVTGDHQNLKIRPWHVNLYPQTCKPLRADPCDLTLNSHSGLWTIVDCFLKLLTLAFTTSIYTFKPFPFSRFQTWMITAGPQGLNFYSQAPSWFSLNPTLFPWTLTVYCIPFNYIVQEPSLYALKYSIFALALLLFFIGISLPALKPSKSLLEPSVIGFKTSLSAFQTFLPRHQLSFSACSWTLTNCPSM